MNKQLQDFARSALKSGLAKCTEKQQMLFKKMYSQYSSDNLNQPIEIVIDTIPAHELDWAMKQVQRSMDSNRMGKKDIALIKIHETIIDDLNELICDTTIMTFFVTQHVDIHQYIISEKNSNRTLIDVYEDCVDF